MERALGLPGLRGTWEEALFLLAPCCRLLLLLVLLLSHVA